ncbi:MAG TPA: carboxypeptidase regulatory-like domain-containing protein, partial [Saprospiraceae bacterium]|nr:carboxypeptidase regulatory-like domain-containing protein [Saprospiraceae bacterium]
MKSILLLLPLFLFLLLCQKSTAQVTTSTIAGYVEDAKKLSVIGATVKAIHLASGTIYGAVTNDAGRYTIPGLRVGGPFKVTVTYIGYKEQSQENVYTNLGNTTNIDFILQETGVSLEEVIVVSDRHDIFSSERTGAATTFDRTMVNSIPTIGSRSINDITKYNPNGNGRSFGGQDSRSNNFTIDGSVFNNGFGLGTDASAGGRTGSTAISLDAIEEVQVNVAPYDVRQTGFVGSGINAVTRSGTNEFSGSVYYNWRNANLYGNKAKSATVTTTPFNENVYGVRIGGPIIKNKLFFFADGEFIRRTDPATPWVAAGSKNIGQVTRVTVADLDMVTKVLKDKYDYETGPYEAYNNDTKSDKFLVRLDYNINEKNKLSLRYTNHDSQSDQLISNSSSDGAGNRRTLFTAMSYQNSGYIIGDNTRSIVGELNSTFGNKISNVFTAGYDYQNEDRQYLYSSKFKGGLFPTIDILKDKVDYISAGMDPFTPNNLLNYSTTHITDNVSYYAGKHTITAGINLERFKSNNSFFDGSNAVYQFNSIEDFLAAANGDSAGIFKFQYRYSALPGGAIPYQVLYANKYDIYLQDALQLSNNFKLTFGVRASIVDLGDTKVIENVALRDSVFLNLDNQPTKFNTAVLPNSKLLLEPRVGFNWDVNGNKSTQIRGGIGIFTGRPPYVYLSNQIGNNGVLTGFIEESNTNTNKYPLVGDPSQFIPATPTLPSTFSIAVTDKDYKYPQVFKTNIAIDQKLPLGLIATAEFMYNRNMNGVLYYDANLEPATTNFAGPDTRPRFPGSFSTSSKVIRRVDNVSRFAVLTNTNEGS